MILNMTLGLLIFLIFIDYILQQIHFSYVDNIHKYEKCRIQILSVEYVWNYLVFGMNQTLYSVLEHFFLIKNNLIGCLLLKILHASLQHYANQELPDVQAGFRKGRGTRDQIANTRWIIKKARELLKNAYLCFIDHTKV